MTKDFEPFLAKLRRRRYDELRKNVYLSEEFLRCHYEPCTSYVLECMQPIPDQYSERLYHTCQRIVDKLQRDLLDADIQADFRYQGARQTHTEVALYGDIELMVILTPRDGRSEEKAVRHLSSLLLEICEGSSLFRTVDSGDGAAVRVLTMKKPRASINILPCIWVDTSHYRDGSKEIDRGIAEYDFGRDQRKSYLPFRNIARINHKDQQVKGNVSRLSRMVRSLQLDATEPANITSYELTYTLYNIPQKKLNIEPRYILSLLPLVSDYLEQLTRYEMYRKVMSPSKKELIFGHEEQKGRELLRLKNVVDDVVLDLQDELRPLNKDLTNGFPFE